MKLLIVRHAIALERAEYQAQVRRQIEETVVHPNLDFDGGEPITAVTEADTESLGIAVDELRPLSAEGIKKMRRVAKGLKKLVDEPQQIFSSPLTRALQTAEILREAWPGLEVEPLLGLKPGLEPSSFNDELLSHPRLGHRSLRKSLLVLVGHEPDLSKLISWYLCGADDSVLILKKGGACLLEFAQAPAPAAAQLHWLAPPGLLRVAHS